jgi:hypothetical protein
VFDLFERLGTFMLGVSAVEILLAWVSLVGGLFDTPFFRLSYFLLAVGMVIFGCNQHY